MSEKKNFDFENTMEMLEMLLSPYLDEKYKRKRQLLYDRLAIARFAALQKIIETKIWPIKRELWAQGDGKLVCKTHNVKFSYEESKQFLEHLKKEHKKDFTFVENEEGEDETNK